MGVAATTGDFGGAGEAAFLSVKSRISPSGRLMVMALLVFLVGIVNGAGLAATLGVWLCGTWVTLLIRGVVGCATADGGRSDIFEGVRDMLCVCG